MPNAPLGPMFSGKPNKTFVGRYTRMAKIILAWSILTTVEWSSAQDGTVYVISRVDSIVMDGFVNEPAWDLIEPVPVIQYEPNFGAPAAQHTEILFGHDDDYFYAAIRAYDKQPADIRGNSLYRDRLGGSDHFEILLDTFNDNETGYIFSTTPTGIRNDAAVTNDATGGSISAGGWLNRDFNTFWDVETAVTEKGWFAEMRIPFSSLRFQEEDGKVTMGLTAQRKIARRSERLVYPAIAPTADWAFLKPSLAQKIRFEGVHSRKRVYITPYGLSGLSQLNTLNAANTDYDRQRDFEGQVGGDIKYSLTNNLTLDLTINTDFAQIEADDQQVNLTRFSLFFPEKREFFQERAGIFDFRTGGLSRLFHSRRIGLTSDGRPMNILGGARIVGRMGPWDVGLMNLQTEEIESLPSENFSVIRLRRTVLNPYSYAGSMFTSRLGVDGRYNLGFGADAVLRLFGDDYLTVQWAQTFDDDPERIGAIKGLNSGRLAAEMQRRRRKGLGYNIGTVWSGPNYNPGVGFVQRNDFLLGDGALSYTWRPDERSYFIWQTLELDGFVFLRNEDQSVESAEIGPKWSFSHRTTTSGEVEMKAMHENLVADFFLSDSVYIPAGSYDFFRVSSKYQMPFEALLRWTLNLEAGSFYDGWRISASAAPTWYLSKHLEFNAEYLFNHVRFADRDQRLNTHIARLRIGTALNNRLSTSALVQYNSTTSSVSVNIRFRYNFRERNDLWIVYNEGLNTDRNRVRPTLPLSDTRAFLMKYTYTFQF